jgi:hypothetical protein
MYIVKDEIFWGVVAFEEIAADYRFVKNHPESLNIYLFILVFTYYHFWRHIIDRAYTFIAKSISAICKPEISHLDHLIVVVQNQYALRFNITMNLICGKISLGLISYAAKLSPMADFTTRCRKCYPHKKLYNDITLT